MGLKGSLSLSRFLSISVLSTVLSLFHFLSVSLSLLYPVPGEMRAEWNHQICLS